MVIFPNYQSKGLGTKLLSHICAKFREDPLVQDITVEDSNPDFSHIRDKVDFSLLKGDQNLPLTDYESFKSFVTKKYKLSSSQILKQYHYIKLLAEKSDKELLS